MSGFKLLAIRPLGGCSPRFLKNLKEGVVYKFYQDYKFFVKHEGIDVELTNTNFDQFKGKPISKIESPKEEVDLYSKEKLNINVSAIVGENGSGKSSLIDFYDLITYYLSCNTFDKMSNSTVQSFNDLRFLIHFLKEYLDQIRKSIDIKDFESIIDLSKPIESLSTKDVELIAKELISVFELMNLSAHLKIKELESIEDKLTFHEILWRYSIEGRKNYRLRIKSSLHDIQYIFQALNTSIIERISELLNQLDNETQFEKRLNTEFNFQLFYQKDKNIHSIHKNGKFICISETNFYYSILLNYSLHSMNSEYLGNWIFKLFHKNDGYQTPIVINPYREYGVIDVNTELELSTDRLIYDIVNQFRTKASATVLGKYHFNKITLRLKSNSAYPFNDLQKKKVNYQDKEQFLNFISTDPFMLADAKNVNIIDICLEYLIKKFRKISNNYMNHFYEKDRFTEIEYSKQIDELSKWQRKQAKDFILKSNSHVTRKFNQTYNFIYNYEELKENLDFVSKWDITKEIELTSEQLTAWIKYVEEKYNLSSASTHDIITYLFPAIFKVDVEFEKNSSPIKISAMSSGEQQYLFNINTITYHINNLKTIQPIEDGKISKYNHLNIILDEIELYYHPQYQKQLVKDLTEEIKRIDSLGELNNFNIQFLTHSPFILSDIPSQNILRLKVNDEGKSESYLVKDQTFGSNIHDLLANDFFLKDGFMGEFAREKINETIQFLTMELNKKRLDKEFKVTLDKYSILKKEFLKKELELLEGIVQNTNPDYHEKIIELIGEPALKAKMKEMYQVVIKN